MVFTWLWCENHIRSNESKLVNNRIESCNKFLMITLVWYLIQPLFIWIITLLVIQVHVISQRCLEWIQLWLNSICSRVEKTGIINVCCNLLQWWSLVNQSIILSCECNNIGVIGTLNLGEALKVNSSLTCLILDCVNQNVLKCFKKL